MLSATAPSKSKYSVLRKCLHLQFTTYHIQKGSSCHDNQHLCTKIYRDNSASVQVQIKFSLVFPIHHAVPLHARQLFGKRIHVRLPLQPVPPLIVIIQFSYFSTAQTAALLYLPYLLFLSLSCSPISILFQTKFCFTVACFKSCFDFYLTP